MSASLRTSRNAIPTRRTRQFSRNIRTLMGGERLRETEVRATGAFWLPHVGRVAGRRCVGRSAKRLHRFKLKFHTRIPQTAPKTLGSEIWMELVLEADRYDGGK